MCVCVGVCVSVCVCVSTALVCLVAVKAAVCWALGQIGRHTPEHAKAVAGANVLPRLLELHLDTSSSEDLVMKVLFL